MFNRPPLFPMYAGLVVVLVTIGLIIGPIPAWWSVLLPTPAGAALNLATADWVRRDSFCYDGMAHHWRQIGRGPHSRSWFEAVVREGPDPAARVYGLAGLRAMHRGAFDSAVASLTVAQLADSVAVSDARMGLVRVPLRSLLPDLANGTLPGIFADTVARPEC